MYIIFHPNADHKGGLFRRYSRCYSKVLGCTVEKTKDVGEIRVEHVREFKNRRYFTRVTFIDFENNVKTPFEQEEIERAISYGKGYFNTYRDQHLDTSNAL